MATRTFPLDSRKISFANLGSTEEAKKLAEYGIAEGKRANHLWLNGTFS